MAVEGRFYYVSKKDKMKKKKKNKKKDFMKKDKKYEKKIKKQSECNHISKNGNNKHFKNIRDDDGNLLYVQCKICKEKLIADKRLLTKKSVEDAGRILITLFGLIRHKIPLKNELYDDISNSIYMIKKIPMLMDFADSVDNKKKNNKKKKSKKGRRAIY